MTTPGYKVFIPTAGLGTRLGDLSKNINKALVAVDNKPGISHIIEKFPKDVEIVVAIGHLGDLIRQYLIQAYPDRNITFVEIEKYEGPGSGLGRTLLDASKHLQCPFIFCSNDTIVADGISDPTHANWMGWDVRMDPSKYRTLHLVRSKSKVKKIHEKGKKGCNHVYIGLAGIKDYEAFWDVMRQGVNKGSIEIGEAYGLGQMIAQGRDVYEQQFQWFDTGNVEELERTREKLKTRTDINVLPKPDEAIWFVNDRVIKYSDSKTFIEDRAKRADLLKGYVPEIVGKSDNMYSYKMIRGKTLSRIITPPVFDDFLSFLGKFWSPVELTPLGNAELGTKCEEFYKNKTISRVNQYFNRFGQKDQWELINGVETAPVLEMLRKVSWFDFIAKPVPSVIHGDLHFENVLVTEDYSFVLLDWRQDFAGLHKYGDIYYDLAKLLHGMIVSHELINKQLFEINVDVGVVSFDLMRTYKLTEIEKRFEKFVKEKGYDWKKVRVLTALIYLNIAPLHHYPYSELLFYLGKSMLAGELDEA